MRSQSERIFLFRPSEPEDFTNTETQNCLTKVHLPRVLRQLFNWRCWRAWTCVTSTSRAFTGSRTTLGKYRQRITGLFRGRDCELSVPQVSSTSCTDQLGHQWKQTHRRPRGNLSFQQMPKFCSEKNSVLIVHQGPLFIHCTATHLDYCTWRGTVSETDSEAQENL